MNYPQYHLTETSNGVIAYKILSEKSYLEVVDSPGHMQCINYDANNTICVIGISKESASCEEVFNKHYQAVQATIANRMKFN